MNLEVVLKIQYNIDKFICYYKTNINIELRLDFEVYSNQFLFKSNYKLCYK